MMVEPEDEELLPPCEHEETTLEEGWVICLDCGHRWIEQDGAKRP